MTQQEVEKIKKTMDEMGDPDEVRKLLLEKLGFNKFFENRKTEKIGEIPIHLEIYESKKDDPVIIFLPGIGTYAELYCEFFQKLSSWGFNVIGVDLRGHGYSGGMRGLYTIEDVIEDVSEVISHCISKYNDRIALFGCSIGSPLALAVAENDPRVKALMCHTLFLTEFPPDMLHALGWYSLKVSKLFLPFYEIDFRTFIDINAITQGIPYAEFMDYDDVMVWKYPVKTLSSVYSRRTNILNEKFDFKSAIIIGEKDEILSPDYAKDIISKSQQPFDLLLIENAGHMIPMNNVKETVLASRDWFNKVL